MVGGPRKPHKKWKPNILEQKIKYFSQATSTPAAPEGSIFQILNDTSLHQFHKLSILDTTQGLKEHFQQIASIPKIATIITPEDMLWGIWKWKEKTSTSFSGRHLGHYHSIILPLMNDEVKVIQDKFLYVYTTFTNFAIKYQVVFP